MERHTEVRATIRNKPFVLTKTPQYVFGRCFEIDERALHAKLFFRGDSSTKPQQGHFGRIGELNGVLPSPEPPGPEARRRRYPGPSKTERGDDGLRLFQAVLSQVWFEW